MDPSVLVVDSDVQRTAAHAALVTQLGAHVVAGVDAAEASSLVASGRFVCALVEVSSEQGLEVEFRNLLHVLRSNEVTILCHAVDLANWPIAARCELLLLGARRLLDSAAPQLEKELTEEFVRALRQHGPTSRDEPLVRKMEGLGIVGRSPVMLRMFQLVQRFAPLSDLPVLVTGETGTGKEIVVNALRWLDTKRAAMPFVPVNCAALPPALAEAELFGHRRGAFSGAESHRLGLIRAAHGGTVFLDEIGDLDLRLQAKLLRVIQEQTVLSIGEDRETPVDVRIIAATHRDLRALVDDGHFREDLFYRLFVLPLSVPPLRERRLDIAGLVQHFAAKHARNSAGLVPAIAPEFIEAVSRGNFPGNVRQLENIVRSALAQREGERALELRDVPIDILAEIVMHQSGRVPAAGATFATTGGAAAPLPGSSERPEPRLSEALRECERATIEAALVAAKGNQVGAARLLGITARSVYTKMKKHRLDRIGRSLPPS